MNAEAQRVEALRLYRRYQIEVVEAFGFCPWARQAREDGRVDVRVLIEPEPSVEQVLVEIDEVAGREDIEIGILLFPNSPLERGPWERWHGRIRKADDSRYEYGASPLTSAAFHPCAEAVTENPDLIKPFIRRSPDPLIQLVRLSTLDELKGERVGGTRVLDPGLLANLDVESMKTLFARPKPLSQSVAEGNLRTIRREGVDRIAAVLDDIRRDREESYGRLAAEASPR